MRKLRRHWRRLRWRLEGDINSFMKLGRYRKQRDIVNLFMKPMLFLQRGMGWIMGKKNTNKEPLTIKVNEIPDDMDVEDFPEDTIFIWSGNEEEDKDEDWEDL